MIAVAAAVICLPIAFRNLGTETFGVLMLLWSILAYAALLDFGVGRGVARATATAVGRGDQSGLPGIIRFATRIQFGLGLVAGVILIIAAPVIMRALHIPAHLSSDANTAILAVALSLPVLLIVQSQQGLMEGLQRFDIVAYVRTPVSVATYAIPAIGAVLSWSLATIFAVLLLARLSAAIVLFIIYRSIIPTRGAQAPSTDELREMFRFGSWLTVSAVIIGFMSYGDRFVIAAIRGVGDVAQYAAPYDLAAKLLLIPGSIGAVLFPTLSSVAATSPLASAVERSRAAGRVTLLVVLPLSVVLIAIAGPLLKFWLGPGITNEAVTVFRILVGATCLHALSFAHVVLIEAWGKSSTIAKYHLAELPVYAVVLVIAVHAAGIIGAATAWAIRSIWLVIWANYYVKGWQSSMAVAPSGTT